jgi:hypothetical protein
VMPVISAAVALTFLTLVGHPWEAPAHLVRTAMLGPQAQRRALLVRMRLHTASVRCHSAPRAPPACTVPQATSQLQRVCALLVTIALAVKFPQPLALISAPWAKFV